MMLQTTFTVIPSGARNKLLVLSFKVFHMNGWTLEGRMWKVIDRNIINSIGCYGFSRGKIRRIKGWGKQDPTTMEMSTEC